MDPFQNAAEMEGPETLLTGPDFGIFFDPIEANWAFDLVFHIPVFKDLTKLAHFELCEVFSLLIFSIF